MINEKYFYNEMNKLGEVFPQSNQKQRVLRCYGYIRDLPEEALSEMINTFIDEFKTPPLPKDFETAAKAWKRSFYLKNGYYYANKDKSHEQIESNDIECSYCLDVGIVLGTFHDQDRFNLFKCNCQLGKSSSIQIPEWDSMLRTVYKKTHLPLNWFYPQIKQNDSDIELFTNLNEIIKEYKCKLLEAENTWKELGFK